MFQKDQRGYGDSMDGTVRNALFFVQLEASFAEACALWALGRKNLEFDPALQSWIKVDIPFGKETK